MPPIGAEHRKMKWRRGRPPRRGVLRTEWPGSPLQSRGDGGPEGQNQGAYPNGHGEDGRTQDGGGAQERSKGGGGDPDGGERRRRGRRGQ